MAWIDDRIWCHPKFTDLTKGAFASYCKALSYASGMNTKGALTKGQLAMLGVTAGERHELVKAGLWDDPGDRSGGINVHDWDDHNGVRDARREADRERKKAWREQRNVRVASASTDADVPRHVRVPVRVTSASAAHVEGSEGSEGSDKRTKALPARTSTTDAAASNGQEPNIEYNKLLKDMST